MSFPIPPKGPQQPVTQERPDTEESGSESDIEPSAPGKTGVPRKKSRLDPATSLGQRSVSAAMDSDSSESLCSSDPSSGEEYVPTGQRKRTKPRKAPTAAKQESNLFLQHLLNEIDSSLGAEGDFQKDYEQMLESVLDTRFCRSHGGSRKDAVKLAKEAMAHFRKQGIKEPDNSRIKGWPYFAVDEKETDSDKAYKYELTPLLRLCSHIAYNDEKRITDLEKRHHLYSKLITYLVTRFKLGKCGDMTHVTVTYLLDAIAKQKLPIHLAVLNMEFWIDHRDDRGEKNIGYAGNHIALLLVPSSVSICDALDYPDGIIVDPMLNTVRRNAARDTSYARFVEQNLNFGTADRVDTSGTFYTPRHLADNTQR